MLTLDYLNDLNAKPSGHFHKVFLFALENIGVSAMGNQGYEVFEMCRDK